MIRRLGFTLLGLALLPAAAGLGRSLYGLLVIVQGEPGGPGQLAGFLIGAGLWLVLFLSGGRPLRAYILAHELSHLLAAWLSGVRAGQLRVGAEGGSVRVARSSWWIALSPYWIPFYAVLILVLHALAVLRWPEAPWRPLLPAALGMSWSFHLSFTFLALSRPQSDIRPYGAAGAYPLILCVNLLTIWLGLAAAGSDTWFRDVHGLAAELAGAYLRAFELGWGVFIRLKNAIFEG